jgi:hypothetical protein
MNHLKEYNLFQEKSRLSRWWKKINTYEMDEVVGNVLRKTIETFDITKLKREDLPEDCTTYTYNLEETDSISGFIEIKICGSRLIFNEVQIRYLYFDKDKVEDVNDTIKDKFFKFFDKKWNENQKLKVELKKKQFKDKYGSI